MLPRKIFKIKCPRLANNAFPEISACLLALGEGQLPPCPPACYGPGFYVDL